MDRNARILSVVTAAFLVSVGGYLFWNPRGQPRSRFGGPPPPNPEGSATVSLVDPHPLRAGSPTDTTASANPPHLSFTQHLERLRESGWELSRDELQDAGQTNLFDALERLRPYWLSDTLGASVRVGGQLIGTIDTLRDVPTETTDLVRLEFSPTEPHWVVRVFFLKG